MSKVRDRFETALKLSAITEGVILPNAREEMRPRNKSEIRELEWQRHQARAWLGERCASDTIEAAVDRLLGHGSVIAPTDFDFAIVAEMDDAAIGVFAWSGEDRDRLKMLRDEAWKAAPA